MLLYLYQSDKILNGHCIRVMGYRFARQRFEYDSITSEILMKGVGKDMVTSCRGNKKSPRDNLGDLEFGTPTGNRTPVTAVKGRCPNR